MKRALICGIVLTSFLASSVQADELSDIKDKKQEQQSQLESQKKINEQIKFNLELSSEDVKALTDLLDQSDKKAAPMLTKLSDMRNEREELEGKIVALEKDADQYEADIKKRDKTLAKGRVSVKLKEANNFSQFSKNAVELIQGKDSESESLERKLQEANSQAGKLTEKLIAKDSDIRDLEKSIVSGSVDLNAYEKNQTKFIEELSEMKDKQAQLEKDKKKSEEDIKSTEKVIKDLSEQIVELEKKELESSSQSETSNASTSSTSVTSVVSPTPNILKGINAIGDKGDANLDPHVAKVRALISQKFNIPAGNIGGYRPGDAGDHGSGHALDVMTYTNSQLGHEISDWLIANYSELGISYIIFEQKFYSRVNNIYGGANSWGQMPDRGGTTANHYDHVHISFN